MALWGRSVLGRQKVPWKVPPGSAKVPPRFQQGCSKFHQMFSKFRGVSGCPGRSVCLGLPKGSAEVSTKVSPRFHQGCASFVISLVFGADPWPSSGNKVLITSCIYIYIYNIIYIYIFIYLFIYLYCFYGAGR